MPILENTLPEATLVAWQLKTAIARDVILGNWILLRLNVYFLKVAPWYQKRNSLKIALLRLYYVYKHCL